MAIRNVVSGQKTLEDLDKIEEEPGNTVSMASILDKMHDYKILSVTDNDASKKFRVSAKSYDEKEFVFEFLMEKKNGYWKFTRLNNMGEICSTFEELAKDSIINYFKETQHIEIEYKEKVKEDNKTFKNSGFLDYCEACMKTENAYWDKLADVPTNPFSDIVNKYRIRRSQNLYNLRNVQQIMEIWPERAKDAATIAEYDEYRGKRDKYKKVMDGFMKAVGYENK